MEYFVLGQREIVLGFMMIGIKGRIITNRTEALEAFNSCIGETSSFESSDNRPKVLILTEDVSDMLENEVVQWQQKGKTPLIVEIPGLAGRLEGKKSLSQLIREAVGIQI